MSNFTKEEMEFILDGTRHWCNKNVPTPWVFEFKKKVESMIDNYCEHNQEGGEVEIFVDTCSECNAYLLRETHHDNQ